MIYNIFMNYGRRRVITAFDFYQIVLFKLLSRKGLEVEYLLFHLLAHDAKGYSPSASPFNAESQG